MYPPGNILSRAHPSKVSPTPNPDKNREEHKAVIINAAGSFSLYPLSTHESCKVERIHAVTWEPETTRTDALIEICKDFSSPDVTKDAIIRMKESTKQLMFLMEEIQSKTHCRNMKKQKTPTMAHCTIVDPLNMKRIVSVKELELLQKQMRRSDNEEVCSDDCSVYKRLTRKCNCLNEAKYNNFVMQFNDEDLCYLTNTVGEVIKNVKILKKFVYMGGEYAENALEFLNEGIEESNYTERVNILIGISHADLCNVFAEDSIAVVCIEWPAEAPGFGERNTQFLAAKLLQHISEIEEGRRYLQYSSKLAADIQRLLESAAATLEYNTLEALSATLRLLQPPLREIANVAYFCTPLYEGASDNTINALMSYRTYMSLDEIFMHLGVLHKISKSDKGQNELSSKLPMLLQLLRRMVLQYDNNDMNVLFVNILNNIITHRTRPDPLKYHVLTIDPKVRMMKNVTMQCPTPRNALISKSTFRKRRKRKTSNPRVSSPDPPLALPVTEAAFFSETATQRWTAALRKTKEQALLATTVVEITDNTGQPNITDDTWIH